MLRSGVVKRRDFLRLSAAGIATVAVGGVMASRVRAQSPVPMASPLMGCQPGGPLNLFTYDGYQGAGITQWDTYWADNGIEIDLRPVGTEDLLQLFNAPGGDHWDAFTINQGDNLRFYAGGALSPVHVTEVPALADLYGALADNPIWKIADGVYNSVPLTIGPLGINYVKERVPEGFTSYARALEPDIRVSALDSSLNMISTAACAVGADPAVLTREELNGPVKEWLLGVRPQIRVIATSLGDQLTALINDEVDLHLVGFPWNILQAANQGIELGFSIPNEGSYGYVDSIGITPWAANRCNALAYANAGLDPVMGALLNDSLVGLGGTPAINENLAPETRALFPDDIEADFFGQLKWNVAHVDPDGPYATDEEWTAVWNEVKLAG
jgi:spermidine/putrescine-binding protein